MTFGSIGRLAKPTSKQIQLPFLLHPMPYGTIPLATHPKDKDKLFVFS